MLTTVGDQILEIRPKQIIESDVELISDYLVPIIAPKKRKKIKPRIEQDEKLRERAPTDSSASA